MLYCPISAAGTGTDAGGGESAWLNPGNVNAADNNPASSEHVSIPSFSNYLRVTGFDFSHIPPDAEISGITITIRRMSSVADAVQDQTIQLTKSGTRVGSNLATGETPWGTSYVNDSHGGSGNLWGTTWTVDEIKTGFGVDIQVMFIDHGTAYVDYVEATVCYLAVAESSSASSVSQSSGSSVSAVSELSSGSSQSASSESASSVSASSGSSDSSGSSSSGSSQSQSSQSSLSSVSDGSSASSASSVSASSASSSSSASSVSVSGSSASSSSYLERPKFPGAATASGGMGATVTSRLGAVTVRTRLGGAGGTTIRPKRSSDL